MLLLTERLRSWYILAKTLSEVLCVSDEIKKRLLKRFEHERKMNEDIESFCSSIEGAKDCNSSDKKPVKAIKGKRAKTERNAYMGVCMRGAAKGGMGKDMKSCADNFKGMSSAEKKRYLELEVNKDAVK